MYVLCGPVFHLASAFLYHVEKQTNRHTVEIERLFLKLIYLRD